MNLRGTYDERKAHLSLLSKEQLEAALLDDTYNDFLRQFADYGEKDNDVHGHGKRVPYIGWYWRNLTFSDLSSIPIGHCGDFVGFMANNKWDYPQRDLTVEEARRVIEIVDAAMAAFAKGGVVSELYQATHTKLDELWDFLQTLDVTPEVAS